MRIAISGVMRLDQELIASGCRGRRYGPARSRVQQRDLVGDPQRRSGESHASGDSGDGVQDLHLGSFRPA